MDYKIPLATNSLDDKDIQETMNCLKSGRVTAGRKVKEFEEKLSNYVGVDEAAMVNSGSSANLLALSALANPLDRKLSYGDEVIVPALTWSTTVFPVIQLGAIPVFVDCGADYQMDETRIEKMITDKTKAIMPVHILGGMCNTPEINKIAKRHGLFVIEDACEALGSKYSSKYAGTIGDMGTYSFYLSHHITTIEGGMIVSNNAEFMDTIRMMRNHGTVRDSSRLEEFKRQYPHIDWRFMFGNIGYNVRSSDLNATLGISQLDKLEGILQARRNNAAIVLEALKPYENMLALPPKQENVESSWFSFPVCVKEGSGFSARELTAHLESKGIETRPIVAGNLAEHPIFKSGKVSFRKDVLSNADRFMKNGFYFGIHQGVDVDYLVKNLNDFLKVRN